jgi:hypothetical protein
MRFLLVLWLAALATIIDIAQAGFVYTARSVVSSVRPRVSTTSMPHGRTAATAAARAISTRSSSSIKRSIKIKDDTITQQAQDSASRLVELVQPQLQQLADPERAKSCKAT